MFKQFVDCKPGDTIQLPDRGDMEKAAHVINEDSIEAVNAALSTGRPLLVRGEPGTGKSQLARAAAEHLGRVLVPHTVDARTETRDLLWTVDVVARLAEAQVQGVLGSDKPDAVQKRMAVRNFVHPGPLWWAFDWKTALAQAIQVGVDPPPAPPGWSEENGVVVLIDEIDKADPSVPNGLLDALGHRRFDIPGGGRVKMNDERRPLVVITTNEERALPDAFLRRCLVLHLALPKDKNELLAELLKRGRAHFEKRPEVLLGDAALTEAANLLMRDRDKMVEHNLSPPGLAEFIDLLHAVTARTKDPGEQVKILQKIAKFTYQKHPPEHLS
ncbi:MAG: MoxR family ATPase [Polyangiaceae bacterium]|nr:MoxR family ATPase [Polyangiaceae bacterium]